MMATDGFKIIRQTIHLANYNKRTCTMRQHLTIQNAGAIYCIQQFSTHNYRLINAYYLLRENLDKLMHAR